MGLAARVRARDRVCRENFGAAAAMLVEGLEARLIVKGATPPPPPRARFLKGSPDCGAGSAMRFFDRTNKPGVMAAPATATPATRSDCPLHYNQTTARVVQARQTERFEDHRVDFDRFIVDDFANAVVLTL